MSERHEVLFGVLNQIRDIACYRELYATVLKELLIDAGINTSEVADDTTPKETAYKLIANVAYNGTAYRVSRLTNGKYCFEVMNNIIGQFNEYDYLDEVTHMAIHNDLEYVNKEIIVLLNHGTPKYVYYIENKDFMSYEKSAIKQVIENRK